MDKKYNNRFPVNNLDDITKAFLENAAVPSENEKLVNILSALNFKELSEIALDQAAAEVFSCIKRLAKSIHTCSNPTDRNTKTWRRLGDRDSDDKYQYMGITRTTYTQEEELTGLVSLFALLKLCRALVMLQDPLWQTKVFAISTGFKTAGKYFFWAALTGEYHLFYGYYDKVTFFPWWKTPYLFAFYFMCDAFQWLLGIKYSDSFAAVSDLSFVQKLFNALSSAKKSHVAAFGCGADSMLPILMNQIIHVRQCCDVAFRLHSTLKYFLNADDTQTGINQKNDAVFYIQQLEKDMATINKPYSKEMNEIVNFLLSTNTDLGLSMIFKAVSLFVKDPAINFEDKLTHDVNDAFTTKDFMASIGDQFQKHSELED